ncbi:uncharacterized protein PGTG_04692 [Puccinia graminis f. sp. tritici CRL 75-36-700-3]|uniref:Uncharacterized protein n=2 Tax=Puccinia graminis f. sp. tritici TaxID=56615 RepID=E3K3T4_PUCGT|nr:uncharacterized protein PGTG_04692 [Puccinia graminis f. sp. tritici CRL 75-36-700-3]EFP78736.1 hypothetical protein PGTG_04692 [Puccinia graminis f. sp. tritici CRL 75-36-700-3]
MRREELERMSCTELQGIDPSTLIEPRGDLFGQKFRDYDDTDLFQKSHFARDDFRQHAENMLAPMNNPVTPGEQATSHDHRVHALPVQLIASGFWQRNSCSKQCQMSWQSQLSSEGAIGTWKY